MFYGKQLTQDPRWRQRTKWRHFGSSVYKHVDHCAVPQRHSCGHTSYQNAVPNALDSSSPVSEQQYNRQQPFLREKEGKNVYQDENGSGGQVGGVWSHCNPGAMLQVAGYVMVNS